MTHSVTFTIPFPTSRDANIILQALKPEIAQNIPGSETQLSLQETSLVLTITTSELSSLRAACNSYLRWIQTAMNIQSIVKKK